MNIQQEIRYSARQLTKNPGFTTAAMLTLALGIGANLTVFLILYGVLLRPLPFPHPSEIVRVNRFYRGGVVAPAYAGTNFLFMRRVSRTLESAAAYDFVPGHVNFVEGGEAEPLETLRVTSDFFRVFEMPPEIGRDFAVEDMAPHAAGVAVVSDALWRHRFSGDPHVLGRAMTLGSNTYTIVGVANPKFRLDSRVDLWVPLPIAENPDDHAHDYNFVARLRSGVTLAQADEDLKRVLVQEKSVYPRLWDPGESVRVVDYQASLVSGVRPALEMLMGAVGLLLLIVSTNILCLLLSRSIARRREMGMRVALGASGWRLLRQLLTENAVLCVGGGCLGLLLSKLAMPMVMHLSPIELPHYASVSLGAHSLAFAAALVFLCAVMFSLVPAIETRRAKLNDALRVNPAQVAGERNSAQKFLVIGEVATSVMLLATAALLVTSFWRLAHTPPGFDPSNVLTFKTTFTDQQTATSAGLGQRLDELATRVEAEPGVAWAAAALSLPTQLAPDLPFDIIGRPAAQRGPNGDEKYIPITAHYFEALRIPLIRGRAFGPGDTSGAAPVVIVNQRFADIYFHTENAVGEHIVIGKAMGPNFPDSVREIVGVVGDTKHDGLDHPMPPVMYLPASQISDRVTQTDFRLLGVSWAVRVKSPQADILAPVREIFRNHSRTALLNVQTMQEMIRASIAQQRFNMLLVAAFAAIALLLGGAGLYGVMSYSVARQKREIGVRLAVGAQRSDIRQMVFKQASVLVGSGLALGIAASIAGERLLRALLFGVAPRDPLVLASACGVLLLTALVAAWRPAAAAASSEPM